MSECFFNLFSYDHVDSQSMDYTVDYVDVTLIQTIKGKPAGTHYHDVWAYLSGPWKGKFHFINWKPGDKPGDSVPDETSLLIDSDEMLIFNVW